MHSIDHELRVLISCFVRQIGIPRMRLMPSSYIRPFSLVMNPLDVPCAIVNTRLAISLGQPRTVL